MDVPHKNYKKTPFDHGTVHGTYRVYTGCRQVAGLPFSCVFFPSSDWEARVGWSGGLLEHHAWYILVLHCE